MNITIEGTDYRLNADEVARVKHYHAMVMEIELDLLGEEEAKVGALKAAIRMIRKILKQ